PGRPGGAAGRCAPGYRPAAWPQALEFLRPSRHSLCCRQPAAATRSASAISSVIGVVPGKPVKMVNDEAMQALGSYEGGRMLFLGLGTGLGSALITGNVIVPLELGRMLYDGDRKLGEVLGRRGLERVGKGEWRKVVNKMVTALMGAFVADYV